MYIYVYIRYQFKINRLKAVPSCNLTLFHGYFIRVSIFSCSLARRKDCLQPSIIFKILFLHGTVCTVYLQHVSYFAYLHACSRYLYTSKKKNLPFWRKLIALLFLSCTSNVRICLSVRLLLFFNTNIACIKGFYKTYFIYIYIISDRSRYDRISSIIDYS